MNALWAVLGLVGVVALTVGTAVFVAAEFSLAALERGQVDAQVGAIGDRRAQRVQQAYRTLSVQLSGAQLGITITTLITGYLAEPAIASLFHPGLEALGLAPDVSGAVATTIALALATTLSMVFGELVPKNLAIARPLDTARRVAGIQLAFTGAFRWLISGLNRSANAIVRLLGIEPAEELRSARSPQELGSLVRSSAMHGTLDSDTASLLDRSLRFTDRVAEDLMTPRVQVEALPVDAAICDLVAASRRTGLSRFPVHGGDIDDIRGAVHVKRAFAIPVQEWADARVGPPSQPVPTVPESLDGDALLTQLRRSPLQLAIVVDEYGGTAGIVTLEDLVEEIVGDVRDEHDRGELPAVSRIGPETWLLSGLLRSDEVAEATGFRMPHGDYETLAGMALARLGRIPDVGDQLVVDGWRLTVHRRDRNRIAELVLTWLRSEAPKDPDNG